MDIEKVFLDPTSQFSHPEDVLAEQSLTHGQKIEILKRWEYDARELEVAEEENMGGTVPSVLGEVLNALHRLDAAVDTEHSPPTKHGGE